MTRFAWRVVLVASAAPLAMLTLATTVASGQSAPSLAPASGGSSPEADRDNRLTLELSDGSTLKGHPVGEPSLRLTTSLGELQVPLAKVAGVQFKADPSATMVLLPNGDQMTGQLAGGPIELKTTWGQVSVKMGFIAGIGSSETVINKSTVADRLPNGRIVRRVVVQVRLKKNATDVPPGAVPATYSSPYSSAPGSSYQPSYPVPSASVYPPGAAAPSLPPPVAPAAFLPDDPDDVPVPEPR